MHIKVPVMDTSLESSSDYSELAKHFKMLKVSKLTTMNVLGEGIFPFWEEDWE